MPLENTKQTADVATNCTVSWANKCPVESGWPRSWILAVERCPSWWSDLALYRLHISCTDSSVQKSQTKPLEDSPAEHSSRHHPLHFLH